MKNKKLKTMLLSLGLVSAIGVGATLAYFSDSTAPVENTFTFSTGITKLTLDEAPVNPDTHEIADGERVSSNTYNKVIPTEVLPKDPTIHITTDVSCYVFVSIENDSEYLIPLSKEGYNWKDITPEGSVGNKKYYVYMNADEPYEIPADDQNKDIVVFDGVKVSDDLSETVNGEKNIKVKAAAVQSDGISYADAEIKGLELLGYKK